MLRKSDLIIVIAVLLLALSGTAAVLLHGRTPAGSVEVRVNGRLTATYSLSADRSFSVEGYDGGLVEGIISGGTVSVTAASCPDLICRKHAPIRSTGESIICLPNRVVITVASGEQAASAGQSPDAGGQTTGSSPTEDRSSDITATEVPDAVTGQ